MNGGRATPHRGGDTGWPGVHGKRVLVTGGTRGLGEQIVRLLAAEGARVATCARTARGLDALAASLGSSVFTRPLDVTAPEELEEFVAATGKRFGGLDGVVACAGGSRGGGFEQADAEDWAATWEVNVGHAARLVRAAVPYLRKAGGGSAVVISSISGWKPGPHAQYGVAKSAQIHLAASLARELGPDGIRVNAVSPGSMLIPGRRWDRMRREDPDAFARFVAAEFPGGAPVAPQEVARVVAFLLSDWSSGISGAHLPVDRAQNAPSPDGY
ncbi:MULTISPECIES: SDR family NAD(P)-dependent oxidoreductase [Streptomyces]|uniref:SDR family NAD(P)-dependent oxidoreductase n=1 Tax=Streptomyces dengpaensis TaxID=2049881 RepID=A0ABN5IEX5_9ACTN|nr:MULTISPECIES: SDR family oxidoreductase [Streptomyces]AVH61651.1 SDR family NAD(P)-dependent oxidoreductase [Streptomyces dengpaensis]PIB04481.1 3-oxoacyl-ACP reductase [Streptomyces sp. HG99]